MAATSSSAIPTTTPRARATRCGPGSHSCAHARYSTTSRGRSEAVRRGGHQWRTAPATFGPCAIGYTLHYACTVDLAVVAPRGDLGSNGYALAEAGLEYLVLQAGPRRLVLRVASRPLMRALRCTMWRRRWRSPRFVQYEPVALAAGPRRPRTAPARVHRRSDRRLARSAPRNDSPRIKRHHDTML